MHFARATWCLSGGACKLISRLPPLVPLVSFRSRSRQADIGFFAYCVSQPAETGNLVPPRSRAIDIRADAALVRTSATIGVPCISDVASAGLMGTGSVRTKSVSIESLLSGWWAGLEEVGEFVRWKLDGLAQDARRSGGV